MDYLSQYHLESYIFDTVKKCFEKNGCVNAYDFFCIVIWKSNRSKSKICDLLLKDDMFENLEDAVFELTSGINKAANPKERLRYVMKEWKFRLPMATAILTALYPDDFTVYDFRVCDELKDFHKLKNLISFESIWRDYQAYKQMVEEVALEGLKLRDKDRYLWTRSFSRQLEKDINQGFNRT
jgi:hypothetical protein